MSENSPHRQITMDDFTIVESCMYQREMTDSAIIYQHELIYIIKGTLKIKVGSGSITVNRNETLLLKKGTYFDFLKTSNDEDSNYESILFFIQDAFILDFFKYHKIEIPKVTDEQIIYHKLSGNVLLNSFMLSLIPYFDSTLGLNREFLKIKTFELLFNLIEIDKALFKTLIKLNSYPSNDLVAIMESNYLKNLKIEDYALLTNRSVSSFKRDFKAIFQSSPHKWIAEKRLQLAFTLLRNGIRKPNDVYFEVGYEDFSHFSKAFKSKFSILPSEVNKSLV